MNTSSSKGTFSVVALILLLLILLGALLRFEHITQPFIDKFSWREASTAMMAQNFYRGHWNILYPELDWGGPGPNYQGREFQTVTYIAAIFYKVFGQHEWVGRGIAVAFGLWGIFALYQLIRRVWDEERALVGAALMSVLPGAVFIERSFLPDPAMVALVITSHWMLVLIIVSGYYLWARYLSLTYPPYHFAGAHQFISPERIRDWITSYYFLPGFGRQLFGWLWTWPVAILVLIGLLVSPSKQEKSEPGTKSAPWFFHWFGAALLIQYLIEAKHLVDDPNNMHLFNPFAAAMGGHAIVSVSQLIQKRGFGSLKSIAVIGMIVIVGLVGRQQLKPRYNPSYASSYQIGTKVSKVGGSNDLVISFGLNPCAIYYSKLRGWLFPPTEVWHTSLGWDYGELDIKSLQSLWRRGANWLMISNSNDEYINADDLKRGRGKDLWMYIRSNFELYDESEDGVIFRLPPYPLQSTLSETTQ